MLTSVKNPLIKQLRKLHRAKDRCEQHSFLLEGTNLLEAACQLNYEFQVVCATEQWQERYPQLWQQVVKMAARVETVTAEVLAAIATTVNPDGVVATLSRDSVPAQVSQELKLGLILERLQDPGNLGTIIRTGVATGIDGLWLSNDSVDPENPKVLRASAGAWFRLPIIVSSNLESIISQYQAQGVQVVATLPQAKKTHWELDFSLPTLILLGNEGAGLSEELVALADEQVQIPVRSEIESLNVAIATAIILYEAKRQTSQKAIGNR